jgi:glycosyltransferase involved in cell wall biosynthesis
MICVAYDLTPVLLSPAGVGRYARDLLEALERRDDVAVERVVASRRRPSGVVGRIALGLARELVYYPRALGRRARRLGANLVHCPAPAGPRVKRLPVVLTIHDVLAWRSPDLFTRANALQHRFVVRPALERAARIVTGSDFTRRELMELFDLADERIAVTPWGLHDRFRPTEPDPEWLEHRFGVAQPYVLTVATLEPRKNLGALLRAFERLRANFPTHTLVVAGGVGWKVGGLLAELDQASERLVHTGYVTDAELVRLYGGAACFVYPSLYEGFGFPPLEAMACGTPVVTSDGTSLPEVVGDAALLVEPTDIDALATAIEDVLSSPQRAEDLRQRGLARARHFTWDACAAATVEVYREAVGA